MNRIQLKFSKKLIDRNRGRHTDRLDRLGWIIVHRKGSYQSSIEWGMHTDLLIFIIYSTFYISMLQRTRYPVLSIFCWLRPVFVRNVLQVPARPTNSSLLIYRLYARSPSIACGFSLALDRTLERAYKVVPSVRPVERVPYRFGPNPSGSKTFPPREKRQKRRLSNMRREP